MICIPESQLYIHVQESKGQIYHFLGVIGQGVSLKKIITKSGVTSHIACQINSQCTLTDNLENGNTLTFTARAGLFDQPAGFGITYVSFESNENQNLFMKKSEDRLEMGSVSSETGVRQSATWIAEGNEIPHLIPEKLSLRMTVFAVSVFLMRFLISHQIAFPEWSDVLFISQSFFSVRIEISGEK